jgi:hypothetical protein
MSESVSDSERSIERREQRDERRSEHSIERGERRDEQRGERCSERFRAAR